MKKYFLKLNKKRYLNKGFTVLEMMVAIAIFLIVITAGMGAVLNANLLHNKSADMRSIMDSLTFIMEDMSRNIRVGNNFFCDSYHQGSPGYQPQDCLLGENVLSFEKTEFGNKVVYSYKINKSTNDLEKIIMGTPLILNPEEVIIDDDASGFYLSGSERYSKSDTNQPVITIILSGKIVSKGYTTPFSLQTTVSQRTIDINN
jgi:prepilin-type N-terminal cleavage/methylation domain-containing protein